VGGGGGRARPPPPPPPPPPPAPQIIEKIHSLVQSAPGTSGELDLAHKRTFTLFLTNDAVSAQTAKGRKL
jgi:hypothetical protein